MSFKGLSMVAITESGELFGEEHEYHEACAGDDASLLLAQARAILKKRLSFFVWQGFFEPLKAISLLNKELIIEAPTSFHKNWVMDHYITELKAAVGEAANDDITILITASGDSKKKIAPKKLVKERKVNLIQPKVNNHNSKEAKEEVVAIAPLNNIAPSPITLANLNNSYSFESFIQGPSNQMAYAAALAVAQSPGMQFSPLFLFGGVGLGKTHLLHAIGLRVKTEHPDIKVLYLSAEQWVNSYIHAIRERKFEEFRKRYRHCDVILIDDIQFLAGKDASQDEFFHTFNCLHDAKKQMVVTSDKYPHEIEGLEERLQTRLSGGLIADIRPPEIETRIAILHKKVESLLVKPSDEVLNYLASCVTNSVRELEGALVRLTAISRLSNEPLSIMKAKEILAPIIKKKTVTISWQKVCDIVANYYDLRSADLLGKSRQRQINLARQVAMCLCRSLLQMSLPEIGRAFSNRDHSTVLSSLRKIEQHKKIDISLTTTLQKLEIKLSSLINN